jgi:hypothetical protein
VASNVISTSQFQGPYVYVNGLGQIQRDLRRSVPGAAKVLRTGLKLAAEPTAQAAELLALGRIRNMHRSPQWAVTRIGSTTHAVYIVPKERGVKTRNPFDPRRRPNLVRLMLERAYDPAAQIGARAAEVRIAGLLDQVIAA